MVTFYYLNWLKKPELVDSGLYNCNILK